MSRFPKRWGGPWTVIKLDAVAYYLECYTKALSRTFELWYIDAFAGSGQWTAERLGGGLFEGEPIAPVTEIMAGSARRALAVIPPFQHFVFIEKDPARHTVLEALKSEYPDRTIEVLPGDANEELRRLVAREPWVRRDQGYSRGVVFLDPYALQVDQATLHTLASTKILDVWYLFPLAAVTRQLARDHSGVGPKAPKLDRVLGPNWLTDLYQTPPPEGPAQPSLLNHLSTSPTMRDASYRQIEQWFRGQLETAFPYVSEPLPLLTERGHQLFSLFLAVSNPRPQAIALAKHFASYVFRNFAPGASRRKRGP